jgi:hypothetical protein
VLGAGTIATVAGRGFRFAAEVSDGASLTEAPAPAQAPSAPPGIAPPQSDMPAIAVLPFSVLSAIRPTHSCPTAWSPTSRRSWRACRDFC